MKKFLFFDTETTNRLYPRFAEGKMTRRATGNARQG